MIVSNMVETRSTTMKRSGDKKSESVSYSAISVLKTVVILIVDDDDDEEE